MLNGVKNDVKNDVKNNVKNNAKNNVKRSEIDRREQQENKAPHPRRMRVGR